MNTYSFFLLSTGVFVGTTFSGPDEMLGANTPAGCGAVEGWHDMLSRRYDQETGQVVPYQPPPPDDTDLTTWAWHEATERWQPVPTLAALKADAWERIKAARAAAESTPLAVGEHVFDADPVSVQRVMGAVQMASLAAAAGQGAEFAITWTLADNTQVQLSAAQMIDVGLSLGLQISAAHSKARGLRAQIDAATTADELNLIIWS